MRKQSGDGRGQTREEEAVSVVVRPGRRARRVCTGTRVEQTVRPRRRRRRRLRLRRRLHRRRLRRRRRVREHPPLLFPLPLGNLPINISVQRRQVHHRVIGPGGYCSTRHRVPLNSRDEGSRPTWYGMVMVGGGAGTRGLHSSTCQLNLSCFGPWSPTQSNFTHVCVPKVLKLSSNVNECQPLRGPGRRKEGVCAECQRCWGENCVGWCGEQYPLRPCRVILPDLVHHEVREALPQAGSFRTSTRPRWWRDLP